MSLNLGLLAAAAGAVFLVAGCDKSPVGASAGNDTSGEASQRSALSYTKQLSHTDAGAAVISMGAQALITQALTKDLTFHPGERARALASGSVHRHLAEIAAAGTPQALADARLEAVLAVATISAPTAGWYSDVCPLSASGVSSACIAWMTGMRSQVAFANAVETTIAAKLKGVVLADPVAARKQVLAVLNSIDIVSMIEQYPLEIYADGAHDTIDESGSQPAPVHFISSDGNDYQQGPSGMNVLKAGMPWLGGGYLSGEKYDLSLESLLSKSTSKETTDEQSQGTAAKTGAEAKAGTN